MKTLRQVGVGQTVTVKRLPLSSLLSFPTELLFFTVCLHHSISPV